MYKNRPSKEDGMTALFEALITGAEGGQEILNQEARGQRSFVNSDTLPTRISDEDKATLEAAGVVFGDVVEDDEIFQYVDLPEGWSKKSTDHSMWSELVDENGVQRAMMFYKAAFYDRRAHMFVSKQESADD